MTLHQFLSALSQASKILATYPFRSFAIALVFLVVVEAFMLIPYIGFVIKLVAAAVLGAQALHIYALAATGIKPSPIQFLSTLSRPAKAQAALAFGALVPFAAGMLFLYFKAGPSSLEFFFGSIFKDQPPARALFVQMKHVMVLFGLPFTFLAGAVVLKGVSGFAAVWVAFKAAAKNWLPVLLLGFIVLAFAWLLAQLPLFIPKFAAVIISGVLLVLFVAWSFAVTYTVSARVFSTTPATGAV